LTTIIHFHGLDEFWFRFIHMEIYEFIWSTHVFRMVVVLVEWRCFHWSNDKSICI